MMVGLLIMINIILDVKNYLQEVLELRNLNGIGRRFVTDRLSMNDQRKKVKNFIIK